MVLQVWPPDQQCQHHLRNVLKMCIIDPSQTYWIRNWVGPSKLWFKEPFM